LDQLTSPQGSVALAISALLLVFGFRLARPDRPREWLAVVAYAAALVAQTLGAQGLLPGPVLAAGIGLRVGGAALLVFGLLLAGRSARARRRAAMSGEASPERGATSFDPVYGGLALVTIGQLLRGPSLGGGVAVLVAVVINGWVALTRERRARNAARP
jgi:hypothetical protein